MRRFRNLTICVLLCGAALLGAAAATAPAASLELKQGDRIVFLGDSITAGGVREKGYVTLVGQAIAKQHADLGVEIVGAGISGNKVPDCQKRLQRDVLDKKPTVVVIYIGINDVWLSWLAGHSLIWKVWLWGRRTRFCLPLMKMVMKFLLRSLRARFSAAVSLRFGLGMYCFSPRLTA